MDWGVGRQSIKGRLYGLEGGEEKTTFWEYRLAWHPGESAAILYQFGAGGTFGFGPLTSPSAGGEELEQTFFELDGTTWKQRHSSTTAALERRMTSSRMVDGAWKPGRAYTWRRVK
jgi:hypothetical protein